RGRYACWFDTTYNQMFKKWQEA
ncbi:TPA: SA1788 family PVL leukocidin-associated protein, partial [Staphylococcus aureus]